MRGECACAIFELQGVNVNGSVRGLRSHEFVERIPGHTLDIMTMFRDLPNESAYDGQCFNVMAVFFRTCLSEH